MGLEKDPFPQVIFWAHAGPTLAWGVGLAFAVGIWHW